MGEPTRLERIIENTPRIIADHPLRTVIYGSFITVGIVAEDLVTAGCLIGLFEIGTRLEQYCQRHFYSAQ